MVPLLLVLLFIALFGVRILVFASFSVLFHPFDVVLFVVLSVLAWHLISALKAKKD